MPRFTPALNLAFDSRNRTIPSYHHIRTYFHTEKRRPAIPIESKILLEFRQSPLLENQIGEQVSQLYGKNTDPRTY